MALFDKLRSDKLGKQEKQQPEEETDGIALVPEWDEAKRLSLSGADPLKREVAERDGAVSYKIRTRSSRPLFGSDITTFFRVEAGLENEIAKIDWKYYQEDQSELAWTKGRSSKLWEYLKGSGPKEFYGPHTKRMFRVKEQEYSWVWVTGPPDEHFELVDVHDTKLARDVREKAGRFIPYTRAGGLFVKHEAVDLLDEIVVTHTALAQIERMSNANRRDAGAAAINMSFK